MEYDPLMETAKIWSRVSHCKRNQVGAVISIDKRIISTGYNGMPSGYENCCEEDDLTKKLVIHAEANAILFAAKEGISTRGSTLHVTLSPCVECVKMIIQSGVKEVFYNETYHNVEGIKILKENGIKCEKL